MTRYQLDDLDLDAYARQWLELLDSDEADARGLLAMSAEDYDFGSYFMMANIAPRVGGPDDAPEALALFAILGVYQAAEFPGAPELWSGAPAHLEAAFAYSSTLGRSGVARALLKRVAERSTRERSELNDMLLRRSLGNDPARLADHDREMASLIQRDVRAAAVLDPAQSLDTYLLE